MGSSGKSAAAKSARKSKTGTQSTTTSSVTALTLGTQYNYGTDRFDMSTANVITVTVAGQYLAIADCNFIGGTTGDRSLLTTVNGTVVKDCGTPGTDSRPSSTALLALAANDAVGLSVWVTGTAPDIGGANQKDTGLTLVYLGA